MLLGEALEIGQRDPAGVEVVGARLEDVLARRRRLVRDDRIDVRIEEHRLQTREHGVERFARFAMPPGERGAVLLGDLRRVGKRLRRALQHELARGEVVVGPVVDPEQLRVALDLRQRRRHRRPAGGPRSARECRASRARWRASGRRRCHGRRSRPGTDARSASCLSAAATKSRPRRVARPRLRRRVPGGRRARRPAERPARRHLAILPGLPASRASTRRAGWR